MTANETASTSGWRVDEAFKWRVVAGEGRETRPVALFMHKTDAESAVSSFNSHDDLSRQLAEMKAAMSDRRYETAAGLRGLLREKEAQLADAQAALKRIEIESSDEWSQEWAREALK